MSYEVTARTIKSAEELQAKNDKHEQAVREREDRKRERDGKALELAASWANVSGELAISDFRKYLNMRRDMLLPTAINGIGLKELKEESGKPYYEEVRFTSEQRISQMDRLAGIEEAIAYLDRHAV